MGLRPARDTVVAAVVNRVVQGILGCHDGAGILGLHHSIIEVPVSTDQPCRVRFNPVTPESLEMALRVALGFCGLVCALHVPKRGSLLVTVDSWILCSARNALDSCRICEAWNLDSPTKSLYFITSGRIWHLCRPQIKTKTILRAGAV